MSNLQPSVIPFGEGLDLQSPKLIASPGSMLDCLNYEIVDKLGYSRIDGYMPYDGNVSLKDFPEFKVYDTGQTIMTGLAGASANTPIEDSDNNIVGFAFSVTVVIGGSIGRVKYISFTGASKLVNVTVNGIACNLDGYVETTITQTEMIALDTYLRSLVTPLHKRAQGLHWHRDNLYAVVPHALVRYEAVDVNTTVLWTPYGTITTDAGPDEAAVIEKLVTVAAGVSTTEKGYFVIRVSTGTFTGNTTDNTWHLAGAVTAGAGGIYWQSDVEEEDLPFMPCGIWKAQRPATFGINKTYSTPGWVEQLSDSFTFTLTLSGVTTAFNSIMQQDTEAESTYYFESSPGNSVAAVLIDYFVVSGAFSTGDAVIRMQVRRPVFNAGTHDARITTSDDMYSDAATTTKLGDVTVSSTLNTLNGYNELQEVMSRYQFITSNFYAAEDMDAFYGVNGTQRAFVFKDGYFSFIYTQDDDELDIPRHINTHCLHLALGFRRGSVLLSVIGEPTNFDGSIGASEIATGDRITGLMPLSGTTLGVFCTSSIWGIVGNTIDNFQLQVISPTTGCLEYTLANCGEIVYMDSRGISTLQTSANYGDFLGSRLSAPVASWLLPRCKQGIPGNTNSTGVSFAIPVRSKNQYRVFFNDGAIMTMTFVSGGEKPVGFTFQKYFHERSAVTDTTVPYCLLPFAWTSEVDTGGTERIYINTKNYYYPGESNQVFGLEQGNSFDGQYISHSFETNWYFGEAPVIYTGIQKLRLHGLSKGYTKMNAFAAGIQEDYSFGENVFSTTAESLNLPRTAGNIYNDLLPTTNICNLSNRGLGVQLRFVGSNTDLTKPEPGHIIQVMVIYSRPGGGPDA